jgi:GGDEF domain-containing protein
LSVTVSIDRRRPTIRSADDDRAADAACYRAKGHGRDRIEASDRIGVNGA